MSTTSSESPVIEVKKDIRQRISSGEYAELKVGFDRIIAFFKHHYAHHHSLSNNFVDVVKKYGPMPDSEIGSWMERFHGSQSQVVQVLKSREQTLNTMEAICMQRFSAALGNFYQARRIHDMVLAIDNQEKYKAEKLSKHSGFAGITNDDKTVVFTLTSSSPQDRKPVQVSLDEMRAIVKRTLEDRDNRIKLEILALRAIRQLQRITVRNEDLVKNWLGNHLVSSHSQM